MRAERDSIALRFGPICSAVPCWCASGAASAPRGDSDSPVPRFVGRDQCARRAIAGHAPPRLSGPAGMKAPPRRPPPPRAAWPKSIATIQVTRHPRRTPLPCRQVCRRRRVRPERQHPIGFQLGLAALVASGHGDVPLFKLRCAARAGHRVVVSGQSYDDPYRGCDLDNDPSCDGSTTIRSASAIASSRLVRGALRDDGRRGVVPQSAPRLRVCRRSNNRRRVHHGDRRQRSTLTVASLPSLGTSGQRSST